MTSDPRHRAWDDIHDLLPVGWHVGPTSFEPGSRRWTVVARGPKTGGRLRPPESIHSSDPNRNWHSRTHHASERDKHPRHRLFAHGATPQAPTVASVNPLPQRARKSGRDWWAFDRRYGVAPNSARLVLRIWRRWVSGKVKWASRSASASVSSSATAGKRGRRPSTTRRSCSRAEASSGCSKTERMADATMLRAERGTRSWALRVKCTRQRCQADAQELLVDGLHEARVVVADDEAHAVQAALHEAG